MIRKLGAADLAAYRALWLQGLTQDPQNFLFTPAEALALPDAALVAGLEEGRHWGAFDGPQLVGLATLRRGGAERLRHMADLGPIYVAPDARRRGLGRRLIEAALAGARALYESLGFVAFGLRPRSVVVDGVPRDDVLMLCRLD